MKLTLFISVLFFLIIGKTSAQTADETIVELYHSFQKKPNLTLHERLQHISERFLSCPYENNALGEGSADEFDTFPRYRTDAFDCETYVDTMLALANAHDLASFIRYIDKIRYHDDSISFIHRNHFLSLDWNRSNQRHRFIRDITLTFHDKNNKPVAKIATAWINKPNWYRHLPMSRIRLKNANLTGQQKQLEKLQKLGSEKTHAETAKIPYIPLTALFDEKGHPNVYLFDQIPNASIVEIIRPNWDLTQEIGTHLNASHLGFAFRINGVLMFREASSLEHKIMDIPLIDYLRQAKKSPTIKGINIQQILSNHLF